MILIILVSLGFFFLCYWGGVINYNIYFKERENAKMHWTFFWPFGFKFNYIDWVYGQRRNERLARFDKLTEQYNHPNTPTQAYVNAYRDQMEKRMEEEEKIELERYLGTTDFRNFIRSFDK